MKLRVLSDLHLEFESLSAQPGDEDVVVLAGDIDVKGRGVTWARQHFPDKPVVYVPGNHEYYGGSLGRTLQKMRESAAGSNVHVLDCASVVLAGVRFVGATLWTDYCLTGNQPLAEWDAQQGLNDFKKVRDEQFRKVRPHQFLARHAKARGYLDSVLATPFEGKTVVVSHHAPSELSLAERYRANPKHLNSAYASRLEHLMGADRMALWVHGHTHDSSDYDVYGTRVVCNPRGYAPTDTNPQFDPNLTFELL